MSKNDRVTRLEKRLSEGNETLIFVFWGDVATHPKTGEEITREEFDKLYPHALEVNWEAENEPKKAS